MDTKGGSKLIYVEGRFKAPIPKWPIPTSGG